MTPDEVQQLITSSLRQLISDANRHGLVWRRIPATVVDGSNPASVQVVLDGDQTSSVVSVVSLSGGMVTDSRVMVDIVPPSGMFIVGTVGSPSSTLRYAGTVHITATTDFSLSTYAGIQQFDVECVGGGGGGGGVALTAAGQCAVAGGGGAGAYAWAPLTWADVNSGGTITVATAVAGGTGNATGTTGTTTDFMGLITCTGGAGGEGSASSATFSNIAGGVGGTATSSISGAILIRGSEASNAIRGASGAIGCLSNGAASGLYGNSVRPSASDSGSDGSDGRVYGNGGAGAFNAPSQGTAKNGGSGAAGIVKITLWA